MDTAELKECGEHFVRSGASLHCELPIGHNSDHGLLADFHRFSAEESSTVKLQRAVFERAVAIHEERDELYGNLWAEDAPLDQSYLVKHKAKRLNKVLLDAHVRGEKPNKEATAEAALDLMNYAAFVLRLVEGDNA